MESEHVLPRVLDPDVRGERVDAEVASDTGDTLRSVMPRTPVAIVARLSRISVRATEMEIEQIERQRGSQSTSDYIRDLVQQDGERRRAVQSFSEAKESA